MWTGFGQHLAQLMPGHIAGLSGDTVSFIDDDQIPAACHHGFDAILIVLIHLFLCPASPLFDGLDGVHGADDVRKAAEWILVLGDLFQSLILLRQDDGETLTELLLHFSFPLGHQSLGADDKDAFNESTGLQLFNDEPGLDGFS